jgi:hypothetical protein
MGRKRKHFKNDEVFRAQIKEDDLYSITYDGGNFVGRVIRIDYNPGNIDYLILQAIMSTDLNWIDIGSEVTWGLKDDGETIIKL